jgi:hypothetical protein
MSTVQYRAERNFDAFDNLIEIKGEVIYSTERGKGLFGAGVCFKGSHTENVQFAIKLIKSFVAEKHKNAPAARLRSA